MMKISLKLQQLQAKWTVCQAGCHRRHQLLVAGAGNHSVWTRVDRIQIHGRNVARSGQDRLCCCYLMPTDLNFSCLFLHLNSKCD